MEPALVAHAIVIAGLVLLLVARFVLRSSFFQLPRESE